MKLHHGDCLDILKELPTNSVDSIVTDPPAGISFSGKEWDHNKGGRTQWITWMQEIATECLRVVKPGGYALVWAIPKTSHWTAMAWEDAGFELRDKCYHATGQGFPKNQDISKFIDKSKGLTREVIGIKAGHEEFANRTTTGHLEFKEGTEAYDRPWMHDDEKRKAYHLETAPSSDAAKQWDGWGTALKPSVEEWLMFRKPLSEKTIAANVLKHGVGGINIDGCRIPFAENDDPRIGKGYQHKASADYNPEEGKDNSEGSLQALHNMKGRFPSNLSHDGSDEVVVLFPEASSARVGNPNNPKRGENHNATSYGKGDGTVTHDYRDTGNASRFFYCTKARKSDRGEGNNHPTVKSQRLMKWLITLITPPKGICLDPFMGSGSTGVACAELGFEFIGIEKEEDYFIIAEKRINNA